MTSPARRVAYELLSQIEISGAFSDYVLNSARMDKLEPRDRRFVTEVVYGSLRHRALLDQVLSERVSRPWEEVDPALRILLRMALYQLWQLDRVPQHAAVDDAVELSKAVNRRAAGFVNGVLRELTRLRPWDSPDFTRGYPPWIRASLPHWLWLRWEARWGGERALEFANSLNERPVRAFRAPSGIAAGESCRMSEVVPGACLPEGDMQVEGDFRYQDEASQLVPQLLGDVRGQRIWDACAAPGGKSAILREMAGDGGLVVSTDVHVGRTRRMKAGLGPVPVAVADAGQAPPFREPFDAVLVDVPCSGLGTVRRNPEIKWRVQPEKLLELAVLQRRIVECAATAVRPGGFLLYSTCSTEPEEDEEVVEGFLAWNHQFTLVRPHGFEELVDGRGFLRTFPGRRRWDGFFAALMRRTA